ncbi:alpha/beta hydrolase fold-3 domain-containing protein [Pleomassaria siparia CBS 279.74]|uniref:Alpha/beta hydrolase fold-3 domain-containing protein n=1 Tax=Pleomassaria siparia CBS 279.74 TaxID=1314801 RepID=A0A6G1KR95_9PLEO|nr:alpha/beta hydrolase fold-3 domain-containing protein [Pleomassaria siparia CBS 279.74]
MADFSSYGGPSEEWLAVERTLPALTFDLSLPVDDLKASVNAIREEAGAAGIKPFASKLHIKEHTITTRDSATIQARSYRPINKSADEKLPVFLYFHGGGFLFGSLNTDDPTCAQTAVNLGILVVSVNYRHTPEHIFPTAWNDTHDGFAWLHKNISELGGDASKIVVGGISAGAQLTASLVLEQHLGKALTEFPPVVGQILLIPALAYIDTYKEGPLKRIKSPEISSYVENENAPLLPMRVVRFFMDLLKTGIPDLKDTKLNIAMATKDEVKGMPPAVFGIAGLDPLRDEGLLYAQTLAEAGVPTQISLFKGVPHAFRRFGTALKASDHWDETTEQGILWALGKPKASGKFDVVVKG